MILNPPKLRELISVFYQLKLGLSAKIPLLSVLEDTILQIHNPLLRLKFKKVLLGYKRAKHYCFVF